MRVRSIPKGVAFDTDPSADDLFSCGPDGHLPIPANSATFFACRRCRRLFDAASNCIGHCVGLAKPFVGADELVIVQQANLSCAWYGGTEVMVWNDVGSLHHSFTLDFWSLDLDELKAKVRALLQSKVADPEFFDRRIREVLNIHHKEMRHHRGQAARRGFDRRVDRSCDES
jgi:hypothetical protein